MKIVQDGKTYRKHVEVFADLGMPHPMPSFSSIHILPGKWMFWFPCFPKGGDWMNAEIDGWKEIEQVYVGKRESFNSAFNEMLDYRRITFAKEKGRYVFKGVFGDGVPNGDRAVRFRKLSDSCELDFNCILR